MIGHIFEMGFIKLSDITICMALAYLDEQYQDDKSLIVLSYGLIRQEFSL